MSPVPARSDTAPPPDGAKPEDGKRPESGARPEDGARPQYGASPEGGASPEDGGKTRDLGDMTRACRLEHEFAIAGSGGTRDQRGAGRAVSPRAPGDPRSAERSIPLSRVQLNARSNRTLSPTERPALPSGIRAPSRLPRCPAANPAHPCCAWTFPCCGTSTWATRRLRRAPAAPPGPHRRTRPDRRCRSPRS